MSWGAELRLLQGNRGLVPSIAVLCHLYDLLEQHVLLLWRDVSIFRYPYHTPADSLSFLEVCLQNVGSKARRRLPVRINRTHRGPLGVCEQSSLLLDGVGVVAPGALVSCSVSMFRGSR